MANLDELKKLADEQGVELTEDMLEAVAGGVIPKEVWDKMTDEERAAEQRKSIILLIQKQPCDLS